MSSFNKNMIGQSIGSFFGLQKLPKNDSGNQSVKDEETYKRIVETANEGIWMVDKDHVTTFVNKRLLDILGYKEKEMLGRKSEEFVPPEDKTSHNQQMKSRSQGKVGFYERRFLHKSGRPVWCNVTGNPLFDEKKQYIGSFGMITDITDRKKIEEQLHFSESKFSAAFHACPDLMSITRLNGGVILDVNEGYTKLLGYTREESVGKDTSKLSIWPNPDERKKFIDTLEKYGHVEDLEITLRRKDGTLVPVIDSARVFTLQGEKCVLSVVHDLTSRKKTEEWLKKNEEKYTKLIDQMRAAVVVHGPDTKILICNSIAQDLLGLSKDQLLGRTAVDPSWHFFKEDGKVAVAEEYPVNIVFKTKKPLHNYILRVHRPKQSNDIWVFADANPILDEKGKILQVVVTFIDVTDRKKAEIEREQFFKFFNLSTDIMVIADPNGAFKKINPTCLKILGYSESELLMKPFVDFVHPDDKQSTLDEMAKQIKIGSSLNFENRYICKDGKILWLSWQASYDKNDGITYATARNITDKKMAEIELVRKNRSLKMVSGINQALIRVADEKTLLNDACRISVEVGGYLMAWVGFSQQDKTKKVSPVSSFGVGVDYTNTVNITWANDERGNGPTGTAIRTGKTQISRDISKDPKMIPWRKEALGWGYKSSISLPLISEGKTFGALMIYAGEVDAFSVEEIGILEELASDLAFGIIAQRARVQQRIMMGVIKKNETALLEAQRIGHFGNWDWDIATDKINWSPEYYRIIGFDPKKSPPGYEEHLKIYTPESIAILDAAVKRNMKTGEPYMVDLEIATPNATCRWITARSESVYDNHGKVIGLRGTAQDITERKMAEQKLISAINDREQALLESQKLSTIVENTFESVALIDLGKTDLLLYVNKAWEKMFGLKKSEIVNKHKALIINALSNDKELKSKFDNCVVQGKVFDAEFQWQKNSGEIFWASINLFPLYNEKGDIYVWCNVIHDITEVKNIDRMKTEFVSLASHQLRTPLTGSKWFLELLSRNPQHNLTADQKELLQGVVVSNERTIALVDDLLDVSRIETGKNFNMVLKRTDIIPLITFAITEKQHLANSKKVTIQLDKKLPEKLSLIIDKDKIVQVFENLLDNAIKYSKPDTKITIGVKVNSDHVTFYVKDQGIGIPFVNQHKIFNRFFRADNASKVDNTGTGLGLYITKGIVEYHQGKVWFESEEGKGSTFYFSLPLGVGRS